MAEELALRKRPADWLPAAADWLQARKRAAALVMIAALATLLATWGIAQIGEETRGTRGGKCAELKLEGLLLRLELAREADEVGRELGRAEPGCVQEVGAKMVRRDWALLPAYGLLVAGLILMLANLRVLGPRRDGRREGERSWWIWVAVGTLLALAAVFADAMENRLLLRLLADFGHPSLVLPATLASLRAATAVKWGALAAAAFAAALLWAWRPRRPANAPLAEPGQPPPPPSRAARWGYGLSWAVALVGAAATGVLACALLQEDPARAAAALRLGGALLVLFWAAAFARAVGVAAEPLPRLPVDEIGPEEPADVDCRAPAEAVPAPGSQYERAYPRGLWQRERLVTCGRRKQAGLDPDGPRIGFGCSGGGIRSATVDLGIFQGIAALDRATAKEQANRRVLDRIDYLSTVSGGGYFGSFLGRLWTRRFVDGPRAVAEVLREGGAHGRDVLRYLRENGRYLSPNGGGDLLQGGAAVLRNWVAIQLVLLTFLLTVFVGQQVARPGLNAVVAALPGGLGDLFTLGGEGFWWSPWLFLPLLVFALCAFPLGWAYWMVEPLRFIGAAEPSRSTGAGWKPAKPPRPRSYAGDRSAIAPFAGLLLTLVTALIVAGGPWRPSMRAVAQLVALTAALTFLWWGIAVWVARRKAERHAAREGVESLDSVSDGLDPEALHRLGKLDTHIHAHSEQQQWLSTWLTGALVATVVLLVVALVDSLGQSLYVALLGPDPWTGWLAGLFSALAMLAGRARSIATFFSRDKGNERPSLPVNLIAGFAALLLVTLILVTLSATSHAIAWRLSAPQGSPQWQEAERECRKVHLAADCGPAELVRASATGARFPLRDGRDIGLSLVALLTGFIMSVFFGQTFPFVNRSSHHALYSARLTRAYLGASNKRRWRESVTRVIRGDDCDLIRYWPPPAAKAAPIHLINTTVNETVSGRSQVEQKDRKGNNLALGPFGFSCGVEHHAVVPLGSEDPTGRHVFVYPDGKEKFRVFEYPRAEGSSHRVFTGEMLPLGDWVGISGAAFSTGLGARTSLGLSLLSGFGNVRLGRWWDSGVDVGARSGSVRPKLMARIEHAAARIFPVQVFLLDEFLARFHGTARRHWYLSDGGHFENLAGYELIRRRLPMIVIIDAEQDADYSFGGLSNLVRKARIDFGAEVRFLDPEELAGEIDDEMRDTIGPLEELRRGTWKRVESPDGKPGQCWQLTEPDEAGFSRVHAALGCITYAGEPESERKHRLLYIKASLTGDETADVLEYHSAHPDFPHESTADQFFDEAQWESYRKLGEHIARMLFRHPPEEEPASQRWWPSKLG